MHSLDVRRARGHLWLEAIKNGFIALLPLTFFRVTVECAQQFPDVTRALGLGDFPGHDWSALVHPLVMAIYQVHGSLLAVIIAIHHSRSLRHASDPTLGLPPFSIGISALINYLMFAQAALRSSGGYGDVLYGIFIGLATAELCAWLFKRRLSLPGMGSDIDINLYQAMRTSLPVIAGGVLSLTAGWLYRQIDFSPHSLIDQILLAAQNPTYGVWSLSLLATLLNQLFWFIGVHGSLAMQAHSDLLFYPPGVAFGHARMWIPMFQSFILLGGSGATLGLLLAILISTRSGTQRQIAKLSLLPSLFNINDTVLFGLPIVMNSRFTTVHRHSRAADVANTAGNTVRSVYPGEYFAPLDHAAVTFRRAADRLMARRGLAGVRAVSQFQALLALCPCR